LPSEGGIACAVRRFDEEATKIATMIWIALGILTFLICIAVFQRFPLGEASFANLVCGRPRY
jgi:hypothetical protein